MMQFDNTNNGGSGFSPSDDELISYLLGSSPVDDRVRIEAWLAGDECHGERLARYASIVLFASEASYNDPLQQDRESVTPRTAGVYSPSRSMIALLALAATMLIAIFSIRGFRSDALSDGRVAMVWAASLPIGGESGTGSDVPEWLLVDGVSDDASGMQEGDHAAEDVIDETNSTMGFASAEPPDWLLDAVLDMQSDSTLEENAEVVP